MLSALMVLFDLVRLRTELPALLNTKTLHTNLSHQSQGKRGYLDLVDSMLRARSNLTNSRLRAPQCE